MPKTLIRITTVPMGFKVLLNEQIRFMQQSGFNVIMVSADGEKRNDIIASEKAKHIIVPFSRKITPLRDVVCIFKLVSIFKKYKPDIVHTHTPKAGLLGMIAAKIAGVNIRIHTVAGLPLMVTKGVKKTVLKLTEKMTSAAANHVWPNSKSLMQFMVEEKLANPEKLAIIKNGSSNGVDIFRYNKKNLDPHLLNEIKAKIEYEKYKDAVNILCIGRMVKDKGIEELLNVFERLQKKYFVHLILVGPFEHHLDPLSEKSLNQIANNSAINHIKWSDDVEYYMACADLFVHPSRREGFPNVLLQAGAMGTPVICSDIPGNIDIIQNEKTGLLFPVTNEDEFYNKLEFAINNRCCVNKFAQQLNKEVAELYDRKLVHNAVLETYNTLLTQHEN